MREIDATALEERAFLEKLSPYHNVDASKTYPEIYFETSGAQTLRVQRREDGVSIDQIVLSSATYLTAAPGAGKWDTTMLVGGPAMALPLYADLILG